MSVVIYPRYPEKCHKRTIRKTDCYTRTNIHNTKDFVLSAKIQILIHISKFFLSFLECVNLLRNTTTISEQCQQTQFNNNPNCKLKSGKDISLKKKNFHTTRQLVTLNATSYCDSYDYSGDSFQNTRHPLITLKPCILLRMWIIHARFTRHPLVTFLG